MTYRSHSKLKTENVVDSVAIAAVFAAFTGSTLVIIVVAGALIANSLAHGDDRPRRIGRR